jgi:hypothetical protein
MFSIVAATATLIAADARIFRLDLVAGPTVDATLSLASAPSGGTTRGVMAAKAGDMRSLEFSESNQLQKTLSHITIAGTGAKALVQYVPV